MLGNTKVLPGSHLPPNLGVAEENQPGGKRKRGNEIMLRDEMDITEMLLEEDETGRITYPYMPAMADIYNCVIGYTVKSEDGGFTIHEPFLTLPDKNSYPDYYKVIENPICLNMIKERLEQQYYNQNIEHLCSDFMAVFHNAKRYNEPKSNIYIYANKLESAVRRKKNDLYNKHGIKKEEYTSPKAQTPYKRRKVSGTPGSNSVQPTNNSNNTTPNAGSNPMAAKNLPQNRWKSLANHIFKSVMNIQDSNDKDRKLVDAFLKLPNKQEYPDYYKVIEKPIDIENIQFRLKHEQFTNLSEFLKAFALMCSNARQYNEPNSQIFTDASKIEAFLVTECKNQNVDQETMIKANLIKPNRPLPTRHHSLKEQMIYFLDEFLNHRDPAGKVLSVGFEND